MPERIALFLENLQGGGAEKATLNLAKGLLLSGKKVDLVLGNLRGDYLEQIPEGVRVISLGSESFLKKIFRLRNYLKSDPPGLFYSILTRQNVIALLASRGLSRKTPIVIGERTHLTEVLKTLGARYRYFVNPVLRILYPKADGVVAVSRGVASDLSHVLGLAPEKIKVLYNPIFLEELEAQSRKSPLHPWFDLQDKPLLLAVGRLSPSKDFPNLLKAFALVRKKLPSRLLILGEGTDRFALEKILKELKLESDVEMPGFEVNPYPSIARAKLLVVSSRCEGLTNVIIEALACGTNVVSTDCPSGPSEVLNEGEFGSLVPVGQPEKLAEAILKALQCPISPELLRQRAKFYSHVNLIPEFLEYFAALGKAFDRGTEATVSS